MMQMIPCFSYKVGLIHGFNQRRTGSVSFNTWKKSACTVNSEQVTWRWILGQRQKHFADALVMSWSFYTTDSVQLDV